MNKNDIKLMSESYKKIIIRENEIHPGDESEIDISITEAEYEAGVEKINNAIRQLNDPIVQKIFNTVTELWSEYEDHIMNNIPVNSNKDVAYADEESLR